MEKVKVFEGQHCGPVVPNSLTVRRHFSTFVAATVTAGSATTRLITAAGGATAMMTMSAVAVLSDLRHGNAQLTMVTST